MAEQMVEVAGLDGSRMIVSVEDLRNVREHLREISKSLDKRYPPFVLRHEVDMMSKSRGFDVVAAVTKHRRILDGITETAVPLESFIVQG